MASLAPRLKRKGSSLPTAMTALVVAAFRVLGDMASDPAIFSGGWVGCKIIEYRGCEDELYLCWKHQAGYLVERIRASIAKTERLSMCLMTEFSA